MHRGIEEPCTIHIKLRIARALRGLNESFSPRSHEEHEEKNQGAGLGRRSSGYYTPKNKRRVNRRAAEVRNNFATDYTDEKSGVGDKGLGMRAGRQKSEYYSL